MVERLKFTQQENRRSVERLSWSLLLFHFVVLAQEMTSLRRPSRSPARSRCRVAYEFIESLMFIITHSSSPDVNKERCSKFEPLPTHDSVIVARSFPVKRHTVACFLER